MYLKNFLNLLTMRTSIERIANEHIVEDLVYDIGKSENRFNLDDLIQDIYLDLMNKRKKIEQIDHSQIRFYLARVVINNIHSRTSPYYTAYKKNTDYEQIEGYYDRLQAD